MKQEFYASEPDTTWLTDITAVWTAEGWLYLAAVIDVYSWRVVGWSMDQHHDEALVCCAFEMAVTYRNPKAGLLHHSDRGSQYMSVGHQALFKQYGIRGFTSCHTFARRSLSEVPTQLENCRRTQHGKQSTVKRLLKTNTLDWRGG
ncbi:DDE-type integrase/transposase/recombinase [Ktedonospora formicarum]|uniref:DDE-type integrase/transposase/recombinase n=1 Tax=Ktedonospora formicarum TaxID=2778364 RepID=UPI003B75BCA3